MIIRKLFKFEGAHIVRDCSSDRCKKSIHGHSYIVEVKLKASHLDNAGMVLDFGLMKGTIRDVIDSFDHAYSLWTKENNDYKEFIKAHSERWIEMPCSPTAELYSVMFYAIIYNIINKTQFNNGEKNIILDSVRVHETDTGWAEADYDDYINIWLRGGYSIKHIFFSQQIKMEWKDPKMWDKLLDEDPKSLARPFINPKITLLYNS